MKLFFLWIILHANLISTDAYSCSNILDLGSAGGVPHLQSVGASFGRDFACSGHRTYSNSPLCLSSARYVWDLRELPGQKQVTTFWHDVSCEILWTWIGWSLVHLRLSIDETDRCNAWKGLRGVVEDDILEDCSPEALANDHTSPKSNDCSMLSLLYVCYMLIYVDLQCCIFDNTHMMLVTWFCMFYHAHAQPWHFLRFLKQIPSPRYLTRQGCIGWHDQVAVFQIVAWMHWKVSKNTHSQATWEACSE